MRVVQRFITILLAGLAMPAFAESYGVDAGTGVSFGNAPVDHSQNNRLRDLETAVDYVNKTDARQDFKITELQRRMSGDDGQGGVQKEVTKLHAKIAELSKQLQETRDQTANITSTLKKRLSKLELFNGIQGNYEVINKGGK